MSKVPKYNKHPSKSPNTIKYLKQPNLTKYTKVHQFILKSSKIRNTKHHTQQTCKSNKQLNATRPQNHQPVNLKRQSP